MDLKINHFRDLFCTAFRFDEVYDPLNRLFSGPFRKNMFSGYLGGIDGLVTIKKDGDRVSFVKQDKEDSFNKHKCYLDGTASFEKTRWHHPAKADA